MSRIIIEVTPEGTAGRSEATGDSAGDGDEYEALLAGRRQWTAPRMSTPDDVLHHHVLVGHHRRPRGSR